MIECNHIRHNMDLKLDIQVDLNLDIHNNRRVTGMVVR